MKTHTFSGKITETIMIEKSTAVWHLAKNGRVSDVAYGILEGGELAKNQIIVDGRIVASGIGVDCDGDRDEVAVGKTGRITVTNPSAIGIDLSGDQAHVVNKGTVTATGEASAGIWMAGDRLDVVNKGLIDGYHGVVISYNTGRVVNDAGGRIEASAIGVWCLTAPDRTATFINHGKVNSGDEVAVVGDSGTEHIVNDGCLIGNVLLMAGNDTIDMRGGSIDGTIYGGRGDDLLITDDAGIALAEYGELGTDTVKSTVTYTLSDDVERLLLIGKKNIDGTGESEGNLLRGNAGDNRLYGLEGDDKLIGGKGNDRLFGGADGDVFVFVKGGDHDRIADFEQGLDRIDVSSWKGFDDFDDVLKHASDGKHGVVITLGHDSLIVDDIERSELLATDFIFPGAN